MNAAKVKSIRNRFVMTTSIVITCVILIFSSVFIFHQSKMVETDLNAQMDTLLDASLKSLSIALWQYNYKFVDSYTESLFFNENVVHVNIRIDNKIVSTKTNDLYNNINFNDTLNPKKFSWRKAEINYNKRQVGFITIVISRSKIALQIQNNSIMVISLLILSIVTIAGSIYYLLVKYIFKPIKKIESAAKLISMGQFNTKIETEGNDEIAHLSKAFEQMIQNIKLITASRNEMNKEINRRISSEEKLRLSEKRYRKLYHETPVMMHSIDRNADIHSVSNFWLDKFGYSREEVIGKHVTDFLTEDSMKKAQEIFMPKFFKQGVIYDVPNQFVKKNGDIMDVLLSAVSEKDKDGNYIRSLAVLVDVTDKKRLETQLQQAQKMESIGRLAGGVAHDYNNALTTIMGFTELAMMDADPAGSLNKDLNEVLKAGKRAKDITRQLLAFARKQTITPRVLDLNENIESMFKMLRRLIVEDIDIVWQPGTNLWPVKMDPSQIDQILVNLCVNARDSIEDVGKITIETDMVAFDKAYCADHKGFIPGAYVMLSISDNGCGMDKEMLDNIFEPFFTTKNVDKGTGLGLATVYGIVKQNNGFINVYSEPGKGTTIKIYLPQHEGKAVEIQGESTEEIPQGHGETILVVEDDMPILKLAKKILEGLGYKVLTTDTPKGAMRLAKEYKSEIQLLATDVIMPEMNGRELSEQMQSLCPDRKCIFMSGYTANAIAHHGVLDEGVYFIQKPFSKNDLATIVRKVLDKNE